MDYSRDNKTDLLLHLLVEGCGNDEVQECLAEDTSDVVLSKSFYRKRSFILGSIGWKPTALKIKRVTPRIAIAILIALLVLATAVFCIEPLRNLLFKSVHKWYDDHIEIKYDDGVEDGKTGQALDKIILNKPDPLPEGVEEDVLTHPNNPSGFTADYYRGDEYLATFSQFVKTEGSIINISNENCTIYTMKIGDKETTLYHYKKGTYLFYWEDEYHHYDLIGTDLDILLDFMSRIK